MLSHLNAFISFTAETGPGTVVAVKDAIDVRDTVTTAGGLLLPQEARTEDASVVTSIREHRCVVIGKTNMHEWAFGSTGMNPHYGVTRNPCDERRVSGGSSGGSAVAVACGMCDWAIGTDTGGSIRIPAALCGIVGLKPTTGLISTDRVVPLSRSLDTVGPMARDVLGAAHAFSMMTGQPGSVPPQPADLGAVRIATPRDWDGDLDEQTRDTWVKVSAGLPRIDFPTIPRMAKACLAIMYADAGAFHRRWLESRPDLYGEEVLERLRSTFRVSGADLVDATMERKRLIKEVEEAMWGIDALMLPATGCVAPLIADRINTEPLARLTRPFNLTGQPAIASPVPIEGMPVGIQLVGRSHDDVRLLEIAWALERAWRTTRELGVAALTAGTGDRESQQKGVGG
jgi:aspartyl-tRNA(Asn)/glutamyl-tRNA(Gln) amidotransferase subunit A